MQTAIKCLIRMLTALYDSLWGDSESLSAKEYVEDTLVENALSAETPPDFEKAIRRTLLEETYTSANLSEKDEAIRLYSNEKLLAAKAYAIAYVDDNGAMDFIVNAMQASPTDLCGIRLMSENILEELDCLLYQDRPTGGTDDKVL